MSKYKMLAIDLDETLLTPEKTISEENIKWVRKANEAGAKVVISTGRGYENMKQYRTELAFENPLVLVNGAEAWDESVEIIQRNLIEEEDIHHLHSIVQETNTNFWVYGVESLYRKEKWHPSLLSERFTQFVIHNEDQHFLTQVKEEMLTKSDRLEITRSSYHNIEFTLKGTSKATGVRAVCNYLNIGMDEVMAIGDNFNDKKLIQSAGLGVAMGNAVPELKELADAVTDRNTADGVAKAIQTYIFEK